MRFRDEDLVGEFIKQVADTETVIQGSDLRHDALGVQEFLFVKKFFLIFGLKDRFPVGVFHKIPFDYSMLEYGLIHGFDIFQRDIGIDSIGSK